GRDDVRLLVARRQSWTLTHARFWQLPEMLRPGDLVVVNTSATLPAAVPACSGDDAALELHVSTALPAGLWLVEVREPQGPASTPFLGAAAGWVLRLPGGATVELLAPYAGGARLWVASVQ